MRQMTLDDIDAVFAIEQAVQAYPWTRGNFGDSLAGGHICLVDEADGEMRSYVILMPAVDEAELLNIGVAVLHQRKGLGRRLLRETLAFACAKKMQRIFLEVRPSNTAAVALYRSAGFVEVGVRRGYYQNLNGSEDALVMACELAGDENG